MMFDLFDEEGIWDGRIAQAYKDAFDIATESDDAPRARIFATRAYEPRCLFEGEDSPTTTKMKRTADQRSRSHQNGWVKLSLKIGFNRWSFNCIRCRTQ
ncbi:hypothetical protein BJX66DRAFT_170877 [Aspergillus keveii]|uniref:Uncharacterized protein n=1 Tax=Aspergillus keveii TaxID=714993 RepID=A0ABR4FHE4_9EURO